MKYLLKNPENLRRFIIFIGDIILMAVAVFTISALLNIIQENYVFELLKRPLKLYQLYISVCVYIIMLYIFEMYNIHRRYGRTHIFLSLLLVTVISFLIMFSLAKVLRINKTTMICLLFFFIFSLFMLYLWRRLFMRIFLSKGYFIKRVLFLGRDYLTKEILEEIKDFDYQVIGLFGNGSLSNNEKINGLDSFGTNKSLSELVDTYKVRVLVTAMEKPIPLDVMKEIYKYKFKGIEVYDSAYFYEILTRKFPIGHYLSGTGMPLLSLDQFVSPVFKNIKRVADFLFAAFLLTVFSPLFLIICIAIILFSGMPIFYLQQRVGFQEGSFNLIKFRTMKRGAEGDNGPQWASQDDRRVTKIGKILRSVRLDELPQLVNILKGNMSFIGPRPIRRHFADLIEERAPFYSLRFTIKPGLTGWAQVHYDYGGSIDGQIKKLQYDLYYIKHASVFLDLFIAIKTIQTVIRRPAY